MENELTYRVLVFDDDEVIRKILWMFFDDRGYEIFTFPHPKSCDLANIKSCECPVSYACTDIILTDLNMPFMKGLDFLDLQLQKGCKVKHMALMSGDIDNEARERAKKLGIKVFEKPFSIGVIKDWIETAEKDIPQKRRLYDWDMK